MKKRTLAIVAVLLVAAVMTGIFAACVTEFQLKFMVDGEVYAVVNTAGEETVKLPENPTKEGYIFDGWYWDDGIWAQPFTAESLLEQKLESDMAVYAKWLEEDITKRTFKVTFDSMSGSAVEPVTALYGTLVEKPSDPTRTGYVFVGWYKQADLSEEWDFSSDTLTENITLYAKWVSESDASGCDILTAEGFDFDAEGKTLSIKTPNSQEYFALSSALTVSPYASWTVTSDAEGREEVPSATVPLQVGDNTFYINITSGTQSNKNQYTVNIRRREIYTVTYDFAGGGESASEQVEEDGLAPAKEGTRTGYTFSGWTAGETAWNFEESVVTGDITLTAVWTANSYSVTFDAAGGEETEGVEVTFGSAAQLPVPERSGYAFTGWQKEDGTAVSDAAGAVGEWNIAEDVSLTASWSVVTYDVTYNNIEGATHSNPATYTVEDAAVALQDAAKTGYTFLGWYSDAEFEQEVSEIDTSACEDVELWARWEVITYTATFVNSDGTVGTVDFDIEDTALSEPAVPQRTGYTGAWEDYEIKAEDLTINAVYTPITYDITYENTKGAANNNPATYNIETAITLSDITSLGYTFEGWFIGEEKVESIELGSYGDITLTAKWAVITYTATFVNSDGTVGTVDFDIEDTALSEPAVPQRTGYTGAWEDYEIKAEDLTINAVYTPITYDITYENTKGAANNNPATYNIETATITLADITSPGYTFEGWFIGEEKVESIELGSYGDITLTAKWADMSTENYVRVNENNELDEDGGYILFGQYPQTIMAADVTVGDVADEDGYYLGSDGERYAKVVADPYESGYTFSNNSSIIDGNTYYFKVEPIRWRILSESNGNALILCDSIIANKAYDSSNNNYANSDIRAWLNDEFYKTAFGDLQQALIQTTEVDNSVYSTGYSNPYACGNTFDKVFLLSYREVTNSAYGFASSSTYDTARQMLTSDFSRATGAYMSTDSSCYGNGWWWLRSPSNNYSIYARDVRNLGSAFNDYYVYGDCSHGVVPALNLTLS